MIHVHLYGKLRRFADNSDPKSQSVILVECQPGDTVGNVANRIGIPINELGSNIFLNGRYANLESPLQGTDRLGLFPDDMQLLYKWYFAPNMDDHNGSKETPKQKTRPAVGHLRPNLPV